MKVVYIEGMTRKGVLRCALAGATFSLAIPLAVTAGETGPTRAQLPVDTMPKLEKSRNEKQAPSSKKKLKTRATPAGAGVRPEFVPDQPWETDFYVDNDISGRHAIQIALASFPPRR